MYAKMRASIFTCRRFGYKYCYIFISIMHPALLTRELDYIIIFSPSRDVIVIYFLYFAMHSSLKCIICTII